MQDALLTTLRSHLIENWDDKLAEAAHDAVTLIIGRDARAADAEKGPPYATARSSSTSDHSRRVGGPATAGSAALLPPRQYVTVQVPQWPRRWRYLSPAIPADRGGASSSTSARSPAAMVSTAIVGVSQARRRWRLSNPHGGMQIARDGGAC